MHGIQNSMPETAFEEPCPLSEDDSWLQSPSPCIPLALLVAPSPTEPGSFQLTMQQESCHLVEWMHEHCMEYTA